jgi:phosphatidylglycerol:prolipoprotein diacylglycerol transferase
VGAAGLFIVVHWRAFVADPSLFKQPGMVFYGGLVGGALAAWLYARKFQVPLGRVADAGAPGLALAHAFGRLGCLMGGCCYGRAVADDFPLGVVLAGARRHPVQLYEAAGLVVIAVVLVALSTRLKPRPGALFSLYLGGYALLRLVVERFRGDDAERGFLLPGLLSTSQAIAALAFVAACALLLRSTRRRHG